MQKLNITLFILFLGFTYVKAQEDNAMIDRQRAYLAILLQEAQVGEKQIFIKEEFLLMADKILKVSGTVNVSEIYNSDFQSIWLLLEEGKSLTDLQKQEKFTELLEKYSLEIIEQEENIIQLKSPVLLNTRLIEYDFVNLQGVKYTSLTSDFGSYINNVNGFSVNYSEGNFILTYSTGWGDCPVGCIYRSYKEYFYNPSKNELVFVREYGDDPKNPEFPEEDE